MSRVMMVDLDGPLLVLGSVLCALYVPLFGFHPPHLHSVIIVPILEVKNGLREIT